LDQPDKREYYKGKQEPEVTETLDLSLSNEQLIRAVQYREQYNKIEAYFPDRDMPTTLFESGIMPARKKYKKFLQFWEKGKTYQQRLLQAGNRVGKTTAAGVEIVYHLTGNYPKWWKGHRFTKANEWWLVCKSSKTALSIFQDLMLGPVGDFGSGLVPQHLLDMDSMTQAKRADTVITNYRVRHVSGEWSQVTVKGYEEGIKSFTGTEKNIWIDEECPQSIYGECLMRTMTGNCILIMTWTPLDGETRIIREYVGIDTGGEYTDGEKGPGRWLTMTPMDDAPHLTAEKIHSLLAAVPEYMREARRTGIPHLGAGSVYRTPEEQVFIDPFPIPDHFRRGYALDFGFKDPTAILWAAQDPETDIIYIYAEHYLKEQPPSVHAEIIRVRNKNAGFPLPAVCDPSGGGSSTQDGKVTRDTYAKEFGIFFASAINSLEPGIAQVYDQLQQNRIKVFNTCTDFRKEYRGYFRNDKGNHQGADHLMDCLRYLIASKQGGVIKLKSFKEFMAEKEASMRDYAAEYHGIHSLPDAWYYT
jgi:phage terminase large subunit-like protein